MSMNRRKLLKSLLALAAFLAVTPRAEGKAQATIRAIRSRSGAGGVRVEFDLDRKVDYRVIRLDSPRRIVVDFFQTRLSGKARPKSLGGGPIKGVRWAFHPRKGKTRIVFDVAEDVRPKTFFQGGKGKRRLVLELNPSRKKGGKPATEEAPRPNDAKVKVIVIDPGHGGEDPGAVSRNGLLKEKDLVLALARKTAVAINAIPGLKAHLTREDDVFITLRKRLSIAAGHSPSLFLSIHCDAYKDSRARGASLYCSSISGAPVEEGLKELVQNENRLVLLGGRELDEREYPPEISELLLSLSQSKAREYAQLCGGILLEKLKGVGRLHRESVKEAPFVVLRGAISWPSLLLEAGFISNQHDARKMAQTAFQDRMAKALAEGVKDYMEKAG